jgi:hypothetical protein
MAAIEYFSVPIELLEYLKHTLGYIDGVMKYDCSTIHIATLKECAERIISSEIELRDFFPRFENPYPFTFAKDFLEELIYYQYEKKLLGQIYDMKNGKTIDKDIKQSMRTMLRDRLVKLVESFENDKIVIDNLKSKRNLTESQRQFLEKNMEYHDRELASIDAINNLMSFLNGVQEINIDKLHELNYYYEEILLLNIKKKMCNVLIIFVKELDSLVKQIQSHNQVESSIERFLKSPSVDIKRTRGGKRNRTKRTNRKSKRKGIRLSKRAGTKR